MIYKMLLHCKSICSAHNFIRSVGKAGVILDHLIDEQTANQRFQGVSQSHTASKFLILDHIFFNNSCHLTLAEKLYKQENTTNM